MREALGQGMSPVAPPAKLCGLFRKNSPLAASYLSLSDAWAYPGTGEKKAAN
jgi:hypothetical protein